MISICIPLFNFDSRRLIRDLSEQGEKLNVPYEIVAIDDASDEVFKAYHRSLDLPCFRYLELENNVGRSAIRNLLIKESKYPYLIFMDCDSAIPSHQYLSDFLPLCQENTVCYGGRAYTSRTPELKYLLHWKYGVKRESLTAAMRREDPNYGFCTNNFLADKTLMEKIKFDEEIKGYGHEDTVLGLELAKKGVVIRHIDNPLIHLGLEETSVYLSKTQNALTNLQAIACRLKKEGIPAKQISGIVRMETMLRSAGLKGLIVLFYKLFHRQMLHHLRGRFPSLFIFDLYRLGYYCSLRD